MGLVRGPASAPRPLSPLPPAPFPTGPVHGAWEPSLALASLCLPGSPTRPPCSPITSQGWALCPGAAEGQRVNRRRRDAASSGSLALTKDPGGRREVSASVGSSGLLEMLPSGVGTTGHRPKVLREEPAEIGAQGEKVGSHQLPPPRGNGQGMRSRREQTSQTEADSASAPDKTTNLSASPHAGRNLPQSLHIDASPPRCSPYLFIKSPFSRPIHIFKSDRMKRNFDHCLICHSFEVMADCGDGT